MEKQKPLNEIFHGINTTTKKTHSTEEFSDTTPEGLVGFEDTQPGNVVSLKIENKVSKSLDLPPDHSTIELTENFTQRQHPTTPQSVDRDHRYNLELEDRRFRYWTMKLIIGSFCAVMIIVVLALVYAMIFKNQGMNDSTIKSFLDTLTDILKVLKPPPQ